MARRIAPPGSSYAEQRHYVVPASLNELRGPTTGVITLDKRLDWSGDGRFDLDDPGDLQVLYQTVLNEAGTTGELGRWLNEQKLRQVWHELWLPGRLRALWHARFPELATPPATMAG